MPLVLAVCFSFVLSIFPFGAPGAVRINELYYDHPGKDAGHEFIELIQTDSIPLGLDGYAIEFHNGAGSGWESIWQAGPLDSIAPGGLFVIGGGAVTPRPDAVLELNLQNGPDAVRLIAPTGPMDLLGYGDLDDPEYVEGESAPGVSAGESLGRKPDGRDTDNNRADFHSMVPSPGRFNVPRKDVSLALAKGVDPRAVVEEGAVEDVRFVLRNDGVEPVGEHAVQIQLWDSTGAALVLAGQSSNAEAIPPAAEIEIGFTIDLAGGYHYLRVNALYPADERTGNNVLNLVRRAGTPGVLISEVMSCPKDICPQYVELYNAGTEPYDIGGHYLRDRAHTFSLVLSESNILDPGGYLVLTPDRDALVSCFPSLSFSLAVEVEGAWPTLNRSGSGGVADSVIIGDAWRLPVDAVAYPPQPSDTRGKSLERVDLFPGSATAVWILSRDPAGGTPGRNNSAGLTERPRKGTVSLTPNPFVPIEGEKLMITVNPETAVTRAVVVAFDIEGRKLKTIGAASDFPHVFAWDGTRDGERIVTPGFYIVACEFYSAQGARIGVEKVVVGCGSKRRN